MKKNMVIIVVLSLMLTFGCSPRDKQSHLNRLEAQRDALDKKIEHLKTEIARENGESLQEVKANVRRSVIKPSLFQHFIKVQGTVESDNNILIPAQSNGVVKKIHVRRSERVKEGQLLAELDSAILKSTIAELENALQLVTTIFVRQERLWKKNIGSEIEYLQAKNNKENLEKKLKTVQEQYKLTKILSPISGTVDDILIKEGEMAAAGQGTIRVVQLSKLKITASLSENHISSIKKNDRVLIHIPVTDKEMNLAIDAVSQVIDPNNRTFLIEINIPTQEKGLKPNMLAVVTINDYSNPEALTVPQNVVQEIGNEYFLFVAEQQNGQWVAQKRIVIPGENYNNRLEILSGLTSGESVITLGFQALADGQPLSIQQED